MQPASVCIRSWHRLRCCAVRGRMRVLRALGSAPPVACGGQCSWRVGTDKAYSTLAACSQHLPGAAWRHGTMHHAAINHACAHIAMQRAATGMRGRALQAANSITNMSYGSACYTYGGCPVPQLSKVILGGEVPAGNCSQLAVTS